MAVTIEIGSHYFMWPEAYNLIASPASQPSLRIIWQKHETAHSGILPLDRLLPSQNTYICDKKRQQTNVPWQRFGKK
jgi:hypothetical protein